MLLLGGRRRKRRTPLLRLALITLIALSHITSGKKKISPSVWSTSLFPKLVTIQWGVFSPPSLFHPRQLMRGVLLRSCVLVVSASTVLHLHHLGGGDNWGCVTWHMKMSLCRTAVQACHRKSHQPPWPWPSWPSWPSWLVSFGGSRNKKKTNTVLDLLTDYGEMSASFLRQLPGCLCPTLVGT